MRAFAMVPPVAVRWARSPAARLVAGFVREQSW
jgi:hypothetical protein